MLVHSFEIVVVVFQFFTQAGGNAIQTDFTSHKTSFSLLMFEDVNFKHHAVVKFMQLPLISEVNRLRYEKNTPNPISTRRNRDVGSVLVLYNIPHLSRTTSNFEMEMIYALRIFFKRESMVCYKNILKK